MYEVSKCSFSCPVCGEKFCISGNWWNQVILHHVLDYLYRLHLTKRHQISFDKKFLIETLIWTPLIILKNFGYSIAGIEENIMSLDKSIQSGQEHRKPYSGTKAIGATCRNHGSCEWCHGNRIYKNEKRNLASEQRLKEFNQGSCKWRDDFTWICFNGDSEMCADVVDDDYCRECRLFEVKENE